MFTLLSVVIIATACMHMLVNSYLKLFRALYFIIRYTAYHFSFLLLPYSFQLLLYFVLQ